MNFPLIVGFIHSGLLWIATGVSLLRIFHRIDTAAAVRLLAPVLILLGVGALIIGYLSGMELFVAYYSGAKYTAEAEAMHFRISGPYSWFYGLQLAEGLVPVVFLIPRIRRSMPVVTGISLACFAVVFAHRLLGSPF
jgi:uncharacterized membrane protein YphA (DoxX/SURF4 family)